MIFLTIKSYVYTSVHLCVIYFTGARVLELPNQLLKQSYNNQNNSTTSISKELQISEVINPETNLLLRKTLEEPKHLNLNRKKRIAVHSSQGICYLISACIYRYSYVRNCVFVDTLIIYIRNNPKYCMCKY